MIQHTPGPWIAKRAVNGSKDFGIVTCKGDVLAEVFSDIRFHNEQCPEVVYNARLIAAAPDLLEAVQDLLDNVPPLWECAERAQAIVDKLKGAE